jgi:hypothetical protein
MWKMLIGPVVDLVGQHFQRKAEEKRAVHERKLEGIRQDSNWENIHATNSNNTWRDEMFSVIFVLPVPLAFVPSLVPHIFAGFEVLQSMPDWYKAFLGALVGSSIGVRGLLRWKSQ